MWLASLALLAAGASAALAEPLPRVLSDADAGRYARIFEAQRHGDWRTADRLIGGLQDRLLLGHVQFQRYMHPTAYRSAYAELHRWMKAHGDHPMAERLHALAQKRRIAGWKPLPGPWVARLELPAGVELPAARPATRAEAAESGRTGHDRAVLAQVRRNVLRDRMTVTENMLDGPRGQAMSPAAMAEARATLARGHLSKARFERALKQGDLARQGPGGGMRAGSFYAGLALWAMGRHAESHYRFAAAADTAPDHIGHMGGAADFWAARAALAAGRYAAVVPYLRRAASYSRDMYGLLAARQLADRGDFEWSPPGLTAAAVEALMAANPAIRRAIALTEAGQIARADLELRRLSRRADARGSALLMALSAALDAPATAYRIARIRLNSFGERHDPALFPLPDWQIDEGQPIGRALLLAVARRESGFDTRARSGRGASGLMQLMPRTADYIARKSGRPPPGRAALFDAEVSLELGQSYLAYLMTAVEPDGSLLHVLAAYNAGPGNVREWQRRFGDRDDPLLFLELMGSLQTRLFVRDVLAAYWIYRDRLGWETPTLGELAEGRWPFYSPPPRAAAPVLIGRGGIGAD
ncbi:lytic transglycosylase domain-containing protein [Minwuia thermotolerans]|nr:lytic transglycosylase domain-containing protein [Minwuia thermotolerans]